MYKRLYLSWYESKLYPSQYKSNKGGNDKMLVIVWLKAKDDLILRLCDFYVTIAL